MLSAVGTVKKVLDVAVVSYTFIPMVKTCVETGAINELVIKCVRWAIAHPDAFYIYENFFKNFLPEPNFGHHPFGTMDEGEVQYPAASYGVLNPRGSRQIAVRARLLGSLLAEIKNSSVYRWKGRR